MAHPSNTLNRLADTEFGEIASWLRANEQEGLWEGLGRNAVRHACGSITDPTGCWRTDPKYTGTCKPCQKYATYLASLASHIVDLCYRVTIGLEDTVNNEIRMCCLGCIQNESTQGVVGRAAHYIYIRNLLTPQSRIIETQRLGEYLVHTCLHGNQLYLEKREIQEMPPDDGESLEYQPVGQAHIVQSSKVTLLFET